MSAAGSQMMVGPITGMSEHAHIIAPQKTGPSSPSSAKKIAPSVPCTAPTTSVPLSVARVTAVKRSKSARSRASPSGSARAIASSS